MMRRRIIHVILFLAILAAVLYSPLTSYLLKDFLTFKLEKALGMDIVLGKARLKFPVRVTISDLKVIDKKSIAISAETAYFQLDMSRLLQAKVVLKCDIRNVSIKSGFCNSLNGLLKPLGVPPQDNYLFEDINGTITTKKSFFSVDDLKGYGQNFRFSGYFKRYEGNKVDCDIEFDISKQVLKADEDKSGMFVAGEAKNGWYSTRLSLKKGPDGFKLEVRPGTN